MVSNGQSIGSYDILQELGRGGMAVVYQAYDRANRRTVALKVLPRHQRHNTEVLQRFLREGQAQMELRHPNIVHTYAAGQIDGVYVIAMEHLPGGSLADLLRQQGRPLDLATATSIITQIAAALDYAHSRGVLHRDLKPSNILFDGRGRAVLSDFGIAKVIGHAKLTQERAVLGTATYMSPEQARGLIALDRRSDVYSLGVLLYEMLTGRPPFQGEHDVVIMHAVLHDAPPSPRRLNRSIPPAVEQAILTAIAKNRNQRYASAGQFAAALQAAAAAAMVKPLAKGDSALPVRQRTPAPLSTRSRSPWLYVIMAALALVVLALLWLASSTQPGGPDQPSLPTTSAPSLPRPAAVSSSIPLRGQVMQEVYLYRTPTDQHSPIFRLRVGAEVKILTPDVVGTPVQGLDRWHRVSVVYQGRDVEGYVPAAVVQVQR